MTCIHGFIGACAECDGCGQSPEPELVGSVEEIEAGMPLYAHHCSNPDCRRMTMSASTRPVTCTRCGSKTTPSDSIAGIATKPIAAGSELTVRPIRTDVKEDSIALDVAHKARAARMADWRGDVDVDEGLAELVDAAVDVGLWRTHPAALYNALKLGAPRPRAIDWLQGHVFAARIVTDIRRAAVNFRRSLGEFLHEHVDSEHDRPADVPDIAIQPQRTSFVPRPDRRHWLWSVVLLLVVVVGFFVFDWLFMLLAAAAEGL